MSKNLGYSVDFPTKTITITKVFGKNANIIDSPEHTVLNKLFKLYPDYTLKYKQVKQSEKKSTYKGASVDFMKSCVELLYGKDEKNNLDKVIKHFKDHPAYYSKIKACVFRTYPKCKELMKKLETENKKEKKETTNYKEIMENIFNGTTFPKTTTNENDVDENDLQIAG